MFQCVYICGGVFTCVQVSVRICGGVSVCLPVGSVCVPMGRCLCVPVCVCVYMLGVCAFPGEPQPALYLGLMIGLTSSSSFV